MTSIYNDHSFFANYKQLEFKLKDIFMKKNTLFNIMAIMIVLSLPFCKSSKNDPDPIPPPDNGGDTMTSPPDNGGDTMTPPPDNGGDSMTTPPSTPAGITYAELDNSALPATITLNEGQDPYPYTIVLNTQPTDDVTIRINLNNAPDNLRIDEGGISVTFATITFAASSGGMNGWDIPRTISLTFADNDILSGLLMPTLTHITSSGDDSYEKLPNKDLILRLIDDDPICTQLGAGAEDDFTPNIAGENYGAGTELDPYIICNAMQLQSMRGNLNAFYELGQDIDASSITAEYTCPPPTMGICEGFQPIGSCGVDGICGDNPSTPNDESADDIFFTGTLDGKGFTISNLTININLTLGTSRVGLFRHTSGAEIRNIGLLNVDISSFSSSAVVSSAGGLVGHNTSSSITNSYSTGNISSSSASNSSAGGLVAVNEASSDITNSYSAASIFSFSSSSISNAGGLAGQSLDSSITNSYSTGNISSSSNMSLATGGGLIGLKSRGSITNSWFSGNISSSSGATGSSTSFASGLVGVNNFLSSIINSYYDTNTVTLFENGSEVSDTAVDSNTGTLTCVGGFSTDPPNPGDPSFTTSASTDTGTCDNVSPTIFFNWETPFDIDGDSVADEESVRYDSNNDGNITNTDAFVWNFGISSEYPFIASIPGTADEQAVTMASGFLRFSNTTLGTPSGTDPVFFYDITDTATSITTSGTGVQDTTAGNYVIEDAMDASGVALATPPTVTNAGVINGVNTLAANSEFYLKVTFTRGSANYTQRYRFKK